MPEIILTQSEADALISMEKHAVSSDVADFPMRGEKLTVDLISPNKKEKFLLDIYRGLIEMRKVKYQNRARQIIPLIRLDLGGSPHRNPDGEEIPVPHLHLYREGFADKWAFTVPADRFSNLADLGQTLTEFMKYCNITRKPNIRIGLFT